MKIIAILLVVLGVASAFEVLNVDEILGSKGVFSGMKFLVPDLGSNSISQAVGQFSKALNVPGVIDEAYSSFQIKYKKDSVSGEKKTFKMNVLDIFEHNLKAKGGKETFTMGVNKFSDLSLDQVRARYTGVQLPNITDTQMFEEVTPTKVPFSSKSRLVARAAPDSKNWRDYGVITRPKNQGNCGSCTLFACTAGLESAMALYKNVRDLDLSEQELLDCTSGSGVEHCGGNWPEPIFDYQKNTGQTTEANYRYTQRQGSCRSKGMSHDAKVSNYYRSGKGDENQMKEWVATFGPMTVIIEINDAFYKYSSGVLTAPCSKNQCDHSVIIVGYGTENGVDYWLVKNSWDENWGDRGYIKMARNRNNYCLIADYAILPQA